MIFKLVSPLTENEKVCIRSLIEKNDLEMLIQYCGSLYGDHSKNIEVTKSGDFSWSMKNKISFNPEIIINWLETEFAKGKYILDANGVKYTLRDFIELLNNMKTHQKN